MISLLPLMKSQTLSVTLIMNVEYYVGDYFICTATGTKSRTSKDLNLNLDPHRTKQLPYQ